MFLGLSLLSSTVELGPIIILAARGESLVVILLAGLAYQVGNLIAGMIALPTILMVISGILAAVFSWLSSDHLSFFYLSVLLASISIQEMRRFLRITQKDSVKVNTLLKRTVRIVGFVVSGFIGLTMYPWLISLIGAVAIVVFLRFGRFSAKEKNPFSLGVSPLSSLMVVHQSHYFSYAYLIPVLFLVVLDIPRHLVGIAFVVGWISYASVESLVRSSRLVGVFIVGHVVVATALFCLGLFYRSLPAVLGAWFISGFGGGTVFALTKLNKMAATTSVELEPWEDIGHVSGVILSIVFVLLAPNAFRDAFWASSIIALIAALLMAISAGWISRSISQSGRFKSGL